MRLKLTALLILGALLVQTASFADEMNEKKAHESVMKAIEYENKKQYMKSAEAYLAGNLFTEDSVLKMNTLYAAARTYRRAKLFGREFDMLQRLIGEHAGKVDYKRIVDREYQIAEEFFNGHRDAIVSWLPFIQDADRTIEIYEAALANGPISEYAPDAALRTGVMYLEERKYKESEAKFKEVIKHHPSTESARIAYIELANLYYNLAKSGDGDGANARRAAEMLDEFMATYPDDPEIPWAKKARQEVDAYAVARLHNIASYYHRVGRDDAAKMYLGRIIRDYGTLSESTKSEQLLAKIDANYVAPAEDAPRRKEYVFSFERNTIPLEKSEIIVVPENSNGRWLLPIRDIKGNVRIDSRESVPERQLKDNEDF